MFLSDFTESEIVLSGHILIIDGKRYLNRGAWVIDSIDLKQRVVYKDDLRGETWFAETMPFDKVELMPLLFTTEKK